MIILEDVVCGNRYEQLRYNRCSSLGILLMEHHSDQQYTHQFTSHDQHTGQVVLYVQVKAFLSHHLNCGVKEKKSKGAFLSNSYTPTHKPVPTAEYLGHFLPSHKRFTLQVDNKGC